LRSIDIHTHILPRDLPDWAARYGPGDWISLRHQEGACPACALMVQGDRVFRKIEANCWDEEERIRETTELGEHLQVLSTIPVLFHYWAPAANALDTSRFLNDHLAETVQRHPRHFLGLGTLPMQDPDLACRELERCVTDLGLSGVQIGSHINQWNLNDPALHGFYAMPSRWVLPSLSTLGIWLVKKKWTGIGCPGLLGCRPNRPWRFVP